MSSSDYAIRVQGLSKRYRIGLDQSQGHYRYKSLRDSLGGIARRPLQTARGLLKREPMNEQNSFWALDDVSFDVRHGEVVGIIGRNGAGKSTLLKILSRITKPTKGQIELHGRVGSLLEVGTGFHPELSGRENIYLNGAILGMTRAEVRRKFDDIVAFSEIERFLDTPVKQYSSGMYTRLAFAVAAHLDPEILIVDEVLAVGDAQFQKKCLGKMKDVAAGGRTVLFVSHNMGAVRELCDSGCLLEGGKARLVGSIDGVIRSYMANAAATNEIDASHVHDQQFVGPGRIIRCGVVQAAASSGRFSPELPIRVFADIECHAGWPMSFGIRLRSSWGQDLLHVTSQDELDVLQLPRHQARLWIDLPPVPLNDGDYSILFFLGDRSFQLQHELSDPISFTIDSSGRGQKYATSPLWVHSKWSWDGVAK